MKTKRFFIKKETIANLNEVSLNLAKGGTGTEGRLCHFTGYDLDICPPTAVCTTIDPRHACLPCE